MQLRESAWAIEFRPGGWVRLSEGGGPRIYLQFELTGPADRERFDLKTALVQASTDEVLSGRTWRRIPMADLEQSLNTILMVSRNPPTESSGHAAAEALQTFTEGGIEGGPVEALDEYFEETKDVTKLLGSSVPSGMLVSDADGQAPGRIPHIKAPEGRLTDDFLKDVADAYLWCTKAGVSPAPAIAELADVPTRRVHRWISDARKRGFLPPARAGRAG